MTLSNFSRFVAGKWIITQETVCNDGVIRTVEIEQYVEGFYFTVTSKITNKQYGNNKAYKTAQKAINAAAKLVLPS